jgi:hypothetical protein
MLNNKIEKKINFKRNIKEKNPCQLGLTWLTYHAWYEIENKKLKSKKKEHRKKAKVKSIKLESTRTNLTNLHLGNPHKKNKKNHKAQGQ